MSELSTPEWTAKIVKALKENSRRFAKARTAENSSKRARSKSVHGRAAAKSTRVKKRAR